MAKFSPPYLLNFLLGLTLVGASAAHGQTESGPGGTVAPVAPDNFTPLQPLAPAPGGPVPGAPIRMPPPVYPQGPTAEQDSVRRRVRPEFEPTGMELDTLMSKVGLADPEDVKARRTALASFFVFPRLEFETAYDSNLFRTPEETSDTVFVVEPSVTVRSDWAIHALEFYGAAKVGRHRRTGSEDYEDFMGRVSGRLDVSADFDLTGSVEYGRTHQTRGELIDPGDTTAATVIHEGKARIGAAYAIAPLTLSGALESELIDYDSTPTVDNDDLDHMVHTATFRASYEVTPGTSVFVQPSYNLRRYDRGTDSTGLRQDSEGGEILAGLRWDASGVTFAEFGIGYMRHEFDEASFDTISAPTASARVVWNFTDLWTLTLNLVRSVSETADVDYSGVLNTRFSSRVDYEFLYNTIVSARFEYGNEDYDGSSRTDERFIAGMGVKHLFNEYLFAELSLDHQKLNSSVDTEDFKVTTAAFRLGTYI